MRIKYSLPVSALLFFAVSASAVPIDYSFEIDWTSGFLAGSSSTVLVSLDGVAEFDEQAFTPDGSIDGTLVALETVIDGVLFTASDDTFYPRRPYMLVTNGRMEYIDYYASPQPPSYLSMFGRYATYVSAGEVETSGVVNYESFSTVPAPATLALFGLGFVGLGWRRYKTV